MFRKIKRLYKNFMFAMTHEYENEFIQINDTFDRQNKENRLLRVLVYAYSQEFYQEAEYLQEQKSLCVFPYPIVQHLLEIESGYDSKFSLPYVIHNNKRLYFSEDMQIEEAREKYRYYIEEENLLGGGYATKAPHQYFSQNITIRDCDVLIDLGSAEGILSLDSIDQVEHVVLVESEHKWTKPLQATFAPYVDKVTIINKFISDKDNSKEISLQTLLGMFPNKQVMVKMDIEGNEMSVLNGAKEYIKERDGLTFLCCTYHKANDAEAALQLFTDAGYQTEFSDGYMLFSMYDPEPLPPYFRKGIIRAYKNK